jgi:hypothetical protein
VKGKLFALSIVMITIIITVASCSRSAALTPEKVIDQQDRWLDKTITVRGQAGTLWMVCTEEGCDLDRPCCNFCVGSLALYPEAETFSQSPKEGPYAFQTNGPAIGLEFPNGEGCKGNECDVLCTPLQLGERYLVTGTLRECSGNVPWCVLTVESYEGLQKD